MPDSSPIDLAHAAAWRGIALGQTREQVAELMAAQGVEVAAYSERCLTATSDDDWEMEFVFSTDGSERLRQVSIEGGDLRWNGQPLMDARLDDALRAFQPHGPALWTNYDAVADPLLDESDEMTVGTPADETLLEEGTVWLPERGLGLVICEGQVFGVLRRAPKDLPKHYVGPVTDAQRELSRRPDLEDHLRETRQERHHVEAPRKPFALVRTLLTVAALVALGLIVKSGLESTRQWAQADTLQGRLVAIEQVPMKQFRDFLPPAMRWIFPRGREVIVEAYRVAYTAPDGRPGEVLLERGELYVPPAGLDAEVPIAYVDSNPPRVKGLSRARDAAFIEHVPLAIGVGVLYLAAQFLLSVFPSLVKVIGRLARGTRQDSEVRS